MFYDFIELYSDIVLHIFPTVITFRQETILSILRCIEGLVNCYSKRRLELDCRLVESINPILRKIWASTLRVVGIKQLTDCGFSLLTPLLKVFLSIMDLEKVNMLVSMLNEFSILEGKFNELLNNLVFKFIKFKIYQINEVKSLM